MFADVWLWPLIFLVHSTVYIRMTHIFCPHLPTVQFEGAEWERSSSPTERLRPPGPRSSPLKFRMPQEGLTMVGERVDPTLPLEKQVYVICPLVNPSSAFISIHPVDIVYSVMRRSMGRLCLINALIVSKNKGNVQEVRQ